MTSTSALWNPRLCALRVLCGDFLPKVRDYLDIESGVVDDGIILLRSAGVVGIRCG